MLEKNFKLIRGRYLLPMSNKLGKKVRIEDGYVLTENSKIIEVGSYRKEIGEKILEKCGNELEIIGCEKKGNFTEQDIIQLNGVILPGFVKCHGHDHESMIIGIAKDQPLTEWLDNAVNISAGFMNEKYDYLCNKFGKSPQYIAYVKARMDDISYGITSCMVHHCNHNKYRVEDIVMANRAGGTKMIVASGSQNRNYDDRILDTPEQAISRLDKYQEQFANEPRLWVIPGPDQCFSNGPELLKPLKAWAKKHGKLIHIHSSEEPNTTRWFVETYKMTPVEYFNSIGFLDGDTIVAHQVNCTANDLKLLKQTDTAVVHNPLANTILGSGMPPVIEMLDMGIRMAISTDGSGSADNQNMLMALKMASAYQKAFHKDASLLDSQKLMEMATVDAAEILRMNTGSLEAGKDADIVLHDLSTVSMTPTRVVNVLENLIWASNGTEAKYVIANGQVLVDNYEFKTLNRDEVLKDIQMLAEEFDDYAKTAKEIKGTGAPRE